MSFLDNSADERERLAAHYARLGDGELLKLAAQPWTLSDEAWEALEDELDNRGLEIPDAELEGQMVLPEKRELVLLRRFRDIPEALVAKGRLDSFGIECFLADDNMVRMDWFISNLLGGVKLLVEPEDFTRATSILNASIPDPLEVDGLGD
jgi:hypothetical protein